jgi:hypothetical protein
MKRIYYALLSILLGLISEWILYVLYKRSPGGHTSIPENITGLPFFLSHYPLLLIYGKMFGMAAKEGGYASAVTVTTALSALWFVIGVFCKELLTRYLRK